MLRSAFILIVSAIAIFPHFAFGEPVVPRKLRVGFVLPLTGPAAPYGVAIKNSVDLALREVRGAADVIEPIFEDAQFDLKLAVASFNKLRTVSKTDVIVVWGLGQCKVVAPLADLNSSPMIALCLATDVAKNRRYVLRFQSSGDDYMRTTAEWLYQKGKRKIGVVVADTPYTEEMYQALLRQKLPSQEIQLLDRVASHSGDFYSQFAKLRRAQVDALGVLLNVGQIGTFAKQLKSNVRGLTIFGTNVFGSRSEIEVADGSLSSSTYAELVLAHEFIERYQRNFGDDSQLGFGALAYEIVRAISLSAKSFLSAKDTDATILDAMMQNGEVKSEIVGQYTFNQNEGEGKHVTFPLTMLQIP